MNYIKMLAVAVLISAVLNTTPSHAVESSDSQIGIIWVNDSGTSSNATTGYLKAGCSDPSCGKAFVMKAPLNVSLQALTACVVAVDRTTNDAGIGIEMSAGQLLDTSLKNNFTDVWQPDGGTYNGALISIAPAPGNLTCILKVNAR